MTVRWVIRDLVDTGGRRSSSPTCPGGRFPDTLCSHSTGPLPTDKGENMRVLHTMIRVADLERSVAFYTKALGMKLLRRTDYPEGKFTLAFVGYGDEQSNAVIELTHNWDTSSYDLGNGFGHIALGAADISGACGRVREHGGEVTREPGPMKHGTTVIAFVKDPDGYVIEFIEKA